PASLVPSSSDTAPAQLYTLSLHDALPIFGGADRPVGLLGGHADKQLAVFHHDVHVAGGRAGAVAVVGRGVLQVNAVVAAAGHEEAPGAGPAVRHGQLGFCGALPAFDVELQIPPGLQVAGHVVLAHGALPVPVHSVGE